MDNRSDREKRLDEMPFEDQVNYWTGQLAISIGKGNFRSGVCGMILAYLSKPCKRCLKARGRKLV